MAKEQLDGQTGIAERKDAPKKPRFRDTWQGFVVFVVILLALRFLVFEPFKIPTGSMEPTLIGHEDYGDRIVTNKLAYRSGTNPVAFFGGDPKRFDVFVFVHDMAWQEPNPDNIKVTNSLKRNYIKRVIGLPGESIVISGGDLFLLQEGKETILRKWESAESLQESLWQPVSVPRLLRIVAPPDADEARRRICRQKDDRAFPWDTAGSGKVERSEKERAARVTGPLTLTYRHPVTNVYAKLGRWPFTHEDCPAAHLPGVQTEDGVTFSNPEQKSTRIAPYLANFWSGVECPNCGQVRFPLVGFPNLPGKPPPANEVSDDAVPVEDAPEAEASSAEEGREPRIFPNTGWKGVDRNAFISNEPDTNAAKGFFFYGGDQIVGDLKLEVELEVEQAGGALQLEVGSNLNRASWCVSLGGTAPALDPDAKRHDVPALAALAPGGRHVLTLAYVDGSILSALDDTKNDPLTIDVSPADDAKIESLARLRLHGEARVKITRLNLYRDLFYTLKPEGSGPVVKYTNDWEARHYDDKKGRYRLDIPEDKFMALGDNSPSSVDSRVWGFVPRKNLVGRASFIFWPPSRSRIIR